MARIACLLPRKEMVEQAWDFLETSGANRHSHQLTIDYGPSAYALEWINKVEAENAEIVMARGLQATHIKRNSALPLVELRLTGQEMGLLISRAKALLNMQRPLIGIVGYSNQFCNMQYFDEIFDVDIRRYYVSSDSGGPGELQACALQAVSDQVNIIIGGDTAVKAAADGGIPSLYIASTGDSFAEAFRTARSMAYAIDMEKANTAQMKTLLENTFGIIVQLDTEGHITLVNHVAETLLGWKSDTVTGQHIHKVAPNLDHRMLQAVLTDGMEVFSQYIILGKVSAIANIAPILTDDRIMGAILSAQEVELLEEMGTIARRHQYKLDRVAKTYLEKIGEPSKEIRQATAIAQLYAKSEAPILIVSEPGNGQERFAQAIHNESKRKMNPFVSVNCAETDGETQVQLLFGATEKGSSGLLATAHGGTVLLENIQGLTRACQHRLLSLLRDGILLGGDLQPFYANIRIIATCDDSLPKLVAEKQFFSELYYILNTLFLMLEPLRNRPEDILYWVDVYMEQYREKYKRYIQLTAGGRKQMQTYHWPGNLLQLQSFCQRLILSAQSRTVDESTIQRLLAQMYPVMIAPLTPNGEKTVFYNEDSARIAQLLIQHGGNRSKVAAALGISTTTLWRKIKRYNLQKPL